MQNILKIILGIWMIWLPIATVIYIFSNGAIGKVENTSIEQLIQMHSRLVDRSDNESVFHKKTVSERVQILATNGIDVERPFYSGLESNEDVSDLRVVEGSVIPGDSGIRRVTVSYVYEKLQFDVEIWAKDKTFMSPWQAEVLGIKSITVSSVRESGGVAKSASFSDEGMIILTLANFVSQRRIPLEASMPPNIWRAVH